jgi:protein SCO1/2
LENARPGGRTTRSQPYRICRFPQLTEYGLVILLILSATAALRAQGLTPDDAGVSEKLGAQAALDAALKDEDGKDITLHQLTTKPTVLTLNYFRCAGICTPLLNGLVDTLNQMALEPDRDYQVVTVSFDPTDTPEVAHQKRINYLKQMKRPFPPAGWRFLTGDARNTREVTDSVGFKFRAADNGFIHPGVIVVLTPKGIVSRYLYGIHFLPADLQMAIQEAARGQVRPTISQVLSFCYSYDPEGRRYVFNVTRAVGAATLLLAGGWVLYLLAAARRQKKRRA